MAFAACCFAYNHFFVDGPLLQDSGQYSFILHRAGLLPKNPPVGYPIREYYGLHVSPAISFASALSYAFPGDRAEWFCLLNGLAYAPLGFVLPLLTARQYSPARARLSDALLLGAVSTAFALSGQVMICMSFPHHEILISAGLCLLLAGLANGKTSFAWVGLAMTVAAREDGGLHAATFLGVVLALGRSGRPFPVATRTLVTLATTALLLSAAAFAVQRAFFPSADLILHEYVGEPAFAHLTRASVLARVTTLFRDAQFVILPLGVTLAIAAVKRDVRYLFGWLAAGPWLVLNLMAAQELKASFQIYTGFPFIASVFWVAAYASIDRGPSTGWRRTLDLVLLPSLLATAGFWISRPWVFDYSWRRAFSVGSTNRPALRAFVHTLQASPGRRVYVDQSMATWTLETLSPGDLVTDSAAPT